MKLWNYIVLLTGISILMALAGLEVAGFTDLFNNIGLVLNDSGVESLAVDSSLWTTIFGTNGLLVLLGLSGAIGIGTFVYTKDKSFLMLPIITGTFFYWISVIVSIVNYARDYPIFGLLIAIMLIPLTVGFILSCINWFMGTD